MGRRTLLAGLLIAVVVGAVALGSGLLDHQAKRLTPTVIAGPVANQAAAVAKRRERRARGRRVSLALRADFARERRRFTQFFKSIAGGDTAQERREEARLGRAVGRQFVEFRPGTRRTGLDRSAVAARGAVRTFLAAARRTRRTWLGQITRSQARGGSGRFEWRYWGIQIRHPARMRSHR